MNAVEKLKSKFEQGLHICIGLDTDLEKIPRYLLNSTNPVLEFNKILIENTLQNAAAYKINFAFYEINGSKGFDTIYQTLELIPKDVLTIADAKRGDIGNTSKMYAQSIFGYFNFDAVTLHPYMGFDSLSPFLEYQNKLNFILALTSNSGSFDFEKQKLSDGKFLYQRVIEKVNEWNSKQNCGIVFGATNLDELKESISSFCQLPVLLPGVGAQGGRLEDIAKIFFDNENKNFIINVSRALIYCDSSENFPSTISRLLKEYNKSLINVINQKEL